MPAYVTSTLLHEGRDALIFRGRRVADDLPVVIKQLRGLYPRPEDVARSRREHDVLRAASGPGVIEVIDHTTHEGRVWLVLEEFGGRSIADIYRHQRPTMGEAISLATRIAEALGAIHAKDIVHKMISPTTVLMNPDSGEVKLTDFGMASVLAREVPQVLVDRPVDADLRYMAPEQTGRMNRVVDARSDFYSLGAVLYELLTGRLPFDSSDPLELIHAHIARQPADPTALRPDIPDAISRVVMTLLSKRAEDRYQSAAGLVADLFFCARLLEDPDAPRDLTPRGDDVQRAFRIPQKLYGRDAEIAMLQTACNRIQAGSIETILVAGHPGIGKTSLVQEVQRPASAIQANLIAGKFDQVHRGVPYASLVQAFRQFTRQVLSGDEDAVSRWGERIRAAVGEQGQALTDLIPELKLIIGEPPALDPVPIVEAENRLRLVVQRFVHSLADAEHPLVLFLDDLQWADLPSIRLLEALTVDPDASHILVIGAYRDNEVDPAGALLRMVDTIQGAGATVSTITLGPLAIDDTTLLLQDALHRDDVGPLASVCAKKTRGNPFYLRRFLEALHADGLLRLEGDAWAFDLPEIERQSVTENVVSFMSRQLDQLPARTQGTLHLAACMGVAFGLHTLAKLVGRTRRETLNDLHPAFRWNLIYPLDEAFWFGDSDDDTPDFSFAFAHDRVQQAAHDALDPDEAHRTHFAIGKILQEALDEHQTSRDLFNIVEHLNHGVAFVESAEDRADLAALNLEAGQQALRSAAFGPAHRYLSVGVSLTGPTSWTEHYADTLDLHVYAAEAAYLAGDDDAMSERIAQVAENATSQLDRIRAHEIEVYGLIARNELLAAVNTALDLLEQLGVNLPRSPEPEDVIAKLTAVLGQLGGRGLDDLEQLPALDDPTIDAARKLMVGVSSAAYLSKPTLFPLMAFALVESTLTDGVSRESPYGFSVFALVLSAGMMIEVGHEQGRLAMGLLERWDDRALRVRPTHVTWSMVQPWAHSVRDTLGPLSRNYADGVDTGDLEYGFWSAHTYSYHVFYSGTPLDQVDAEIAGIMRAMTHHKQLAQRVVTKPFSQLVKALRGTLEDPARLDGPGFSEREMMANYLATDYRGAVFVLSCCMLISRVLFRQYEEAKETIDKWAAYGDGAPATIHVASVAFYSALARLACDDPSAEALAQAEAGRDQLAIWAERCPANFAHWQALIEAELARVNDQVAEAMDRYDAAIEAAAQSASLGDEALCSERAGQFHLGRGSRTVARAYLLEARSAYQRWGALAKVAHLDQVHADLLAGTLATRSLAQPTDVDLESLFRASYAVSSEIRPERLLRKVLEVSIQNAGATRGFLLLERDGRWVIEDSLDIDGDAVVPSGTELIDCTQLAGTVVQYVVRTGEKLVLGDPSDDGRFTADPYLHAHPRVSVLAVPLAHQAQPLGVMYLENHLVSGCFTPARLKTVQVLAAQAAISMENASLVDNLEAQVTSRTKELQSALAQTEAIVDNMVDGLVAIDVDGRVSAANPALYQLLANAPGVGQVAAELLPPALTELVQHSISQNAVARAEISLSDDRIGAAAASPIHGEDGARLGAVVLLRDVTLEKQIDRMKTEFTSTVAHELRTPLTSIIGFTKLVRRAFGRKIAPLIEADPKGHAAGVKVSRNLDIVIDEGERLTALVNDMLDLAKIESGGIEWKMTPLQPAALVERACHACHALFQDGVPLLHDVPDTVGDVFGDADWLQQVLVNLISNAAKFTEEGQVRVRVQTQGEETVFQVIDTGKGIADADQSSVFEKFRQSGEHTGPQRGTGLGLPICREIVVAHGGKIWCESTLGSGSTFAFRLPRHHPETG